MRHKHHVTLPEWKVILDRYVDTDKCPDDIAEIECVGVNSVRWAMGKLGMVDKITTWTVTNDKKWEKIFEEHKGKTRKQLVSILGMPYITIAHACGRIVNGSNIVSRYRTKDDWLNLVNDEDNIGLTRVELCAKLDIKSSTLREALKRHGIYHNKALN